MPKKKKYTQPPSMITVDKKLKAPSKLNKRKPLNLKKYKYATEYLQDVEKEKKGIPTRGRMPKLERSLVTRKSHGGSTSPVTGKADGPYKVLPSEEVPIMPKPPKSKKKTKPKKPSKPESLLPKKMGGGKVKPKRKKRKPFEPYITMEAKGGGKVKGYKKGGTLKEDKRYQEGKKTRGRMEILKKDKNKPRSIKNVATVKQDPKDKGRLATGKKTGNKVSTVTARSRKDGKLRNKTVNLSKYSKRLPTSPIGIAALLGPIAYDQMSKTGAESFKNMKEVERGKMRKTIRNIKGTPKEIAKDKKAKKVVTAPRPKRKPKVSQNNKIKTNNLKPEVFISGDVSYDMKKQPKRMGGGKVMKKNMGGSLKAPNNPGLAKLPTPVRNKMGYAKGGGKVEYKKHGGKVIKTNMSGDDVVRGCYD